MKKFYQRRNLAGFRSFTSMSSPLSKSRQSCLAKCFSIITSGI